MLDELKQQISDVSKVYPSLLEEAKETSSYSNGEKDKGFINDKGSLLLKENGDINLSSGLYSQYSLTNGYANEKTIQSTTTTVRKQLIIDELLINKHKLNTALYELSDMRQYNNNPDTAIGNLTMFATVLVKAWEPTLKKWVLIRRLARMPLFSPIINLPDTPKQLDINTNISDEILNMSKGGK